MDQAYWLKRQRNAIADGRAASLVDVRFIHYELARGYGIEAAKAVKGRRTLKRGLGEQLITPFHPNQTSEV
jgi:hypothetical protein